MRSCLLTIVTLLFGLPAFAAETTTIHLRVTGLFSPERAADLRELMMQIPDARLVSIDFARAEAVFAYDPTTAFDKAKPDKIPERLDNAVRTLSRGTFGIKPLCPLEHEMLTVAEIGVVGLDCKGCALAAYECVARIEGVYWATASFKQGVVAAKFDPEKTNREALQAALVKARVELKQPASTKP